MLLLDWILYTCEFVNVFSGKYLEYGSAILMIKYDLILLNRSLIWGMSQPQVKIFFKKPTAIYYHHL